MNRNFFLSGVMRYKKSKIKLIFSRVLWIVFFMVCRFAFSAALPEVFSTRGYRFVKIRETGQGEAFVYQAEKKPDITLSVSLAEYADASYFNAVDILLRAVSEWERISPQALSFGKIPGSVTMAVSVKKIETEYGNASGFFPSGLYFNLPEGDEGQVKYNFRMKKDDYFIRLKGSYILEDGLIREIETAYKNPSDYISKNSFDFLRSRLDRQNAVLSDYKTLITRLEKSQSTLEKKLKRTDEDVKLLNGKLSALRAALASVKGGLFSGFEPVTAEVAEKILDIHKNHPGLGPDAVAARVAPDFPGQEISDKTVLRVYAFYNNEFPK